MGGQPRRLGASKPRLWPRPGLLVGSLPRTPAVVVFCSSNMLENSANLLLNVEAYPVVDASSPGLVSGTCTRCHRTSQVPLPNFSEQDAKWRSMVESRSETCYPEVGRSYICCLVRTSTHSMSVQRHGGRPIVMHDDQLKGWLLIGLTLAMEYVDDWPRLPAGSCFPARDTMRMSDPGREYYRVEHDLALLRLPYVLDSHNTSGNSEPHYRFSARPTFHLHDIRNQSRKHVHEPHIRERNCESADLAHLTKAGAATGCAW